MRSQSRLEREPALARKAASQHGVFTRAQAIECGVVPSVIHGRVQRGLWLRLLPGVYAYSATPATWHRMVMAVCLASGAAAVVSHRAAARLWGLVGFIDDRMIEVTVPRTCRRAYADVVHRPRCLPTSDVDTRDAIRVTTVARTLIDLASCVPVASLEEALDDALRRRLVTVRALRSRFADTAPSGRKGQAALRRLLEVREGRGRVPQSVFETRLLRALRRARLPAPEIQYEVRTARGRAVLDFAYPDKLLAIEADGFEWHSSRRQWDYDRARGTALALLGWRVIHVTWSELHEDPDAVVGAVRAMLVRK